MSWQLPKTARTSGQLDVLRPLGNAKPTARQLISRLLLVSNFKLKMSVSAFDPHCVHYAKLKLHRKSLTSYYPDVFSTIHAQLISFAEYHTRFVLIKVAYNYSSTMFLKMTERRFRNG